MPELNYSNNIRIYYTFYVKVTFLFIVNNYYRYHYYN